MKKTCTNCKYFNACGDLERIAPCNGFELKMYDMCEPDDDFNDFEDEWDEDEYVPSATNGDYSPTCPWNAPGMSIHDFI